MAFLCYTIYSGSVNLREAIAFCVLGRSTDIAVKSVLDYTFLYVDAGTKLFFASRIFGYLVNHMKQRKFGAEFELVYVVNYMRAGQS